VKLTAQPYERESRELARVGGGARGVVINGRVRVGLRMGGLTVQVGGLLLTNRVGGLL
jgi:hypothetical protein